VLAERGGDGAGGADPELEIGFGENAVFPEALHNHNHGNVESSGGVKHLYLEIAAAGRGLPVDEFEAVALKILPYADGVSGVAEEASGSPGFTHGVEGWDEAGVDRKNPGIDDEVFGASGPARAGIQAEKVAGGDLQRANGVIPAAPADQCELPGDAAVPEQGGRSPNRYGAGRADRFVQAEPRRQVVFELHPGERQGLAVEQPQRAGDGLAREKARAVEVPLNPDPGQGEPVPQPGQAGGRQEKPGQEQDAGLGMPCGQNEDSRQGDQPGCLEQVARGCGGVF
jgi:hypothetical protein